MVVYGRAEVAVRSIAAWFEHAPADAELIVVDNASPDDAADRIERTFPRVRLIRSAQNLGFGGGVNLGASRARGSSIAILNSDAMIHPGWFGPIARSLDADPGIGAVAPVYLDEDGRLAEAGSVIGPDARTMALVRPPDAAVVDLDQDELLPPELAFTRTVDFASAAALVVRRRAFEAAGGFDGAFTIGYYEDVDLCLRMATLGWRTVVDPGSRVTHLGAASMGAQAAARRSAENRPIVAGRWAEVLEHRPPLEDFERYPHRWFAARDATSPLRALAVAGPEEVERALDRLDELRAATPRVVATLLMQEPAACPSWIERAVVAMDPTVRARWLRARRFHYSVVLSSHHLPEESLQLTQPQAARVDLAGAPQHRP
jgi:GT2 family glycosyltransferase